MLKSVVCHTVPGLAAKYDVNYTECEEVADTRISTLDCL